MRTRHFSHYFQPLPSYAYDHSAAIRLRFTITPRPNPQNPYDIKSAFFTIRIKSVTVTDAAETGESKQWKSVQPEAKPEQTAKGEASTRVGWKIRTLGDRVAGLISRYLNSEPDLRRPPALYRDFAAKFYADIFV